MSRAIKREPKNPICVVGIGIKIVIKLSRKVMFLVVESHCLQPQNAGKHITLIIEFQNFLGEHAAEPLKGVKLSCPPVQNPGSVNF